MAVGASFGVWLKRRRRQLDLTQEALAVKVGCSVATIQKIESDERRPSRQIAELLAEALEIPPADRATFVRTARGDLGVARLSDALPPAMTVPLSSTPHSVSYLPIPPTPLVGREAELTALARLLQDPQSRLITLIGAGGMGKTRLAIEAATRQAGNFPDGAYFVALAAFSSPAILPLAIADALRLKFQGQIEPRAQLLNYLLDKSLLLVLDNFEHLLSGAELLAEIMGCVPDVTLLVTSRERLNLPGEWVFEIQGLPIPTAKQGGRLTENSAVLLFEQCAVRARGSFALGSDDYAAVARVCQLVEGMPLGIELAASWVRVLACPEIVREIESNLDFLATAARHVPERHRSLRAVFEYSWSLLPPDERDLLRQLAVFHGGFRREAAEQVVRATLPRLMALVDKSLVRWTQTGRYDLHEVIRQYAQAHLAEDAPAEVAARERHSAYYLRLLKAREKASRSAAQAETVRELTDEIDNIRAAWDWAIRHDRFATLGLAVRGLGALYELIGWLREGIEQLEMVKQALQNRSDSPECSSVLGQALTMQALLFFRWGRFDRALELLDESLALLRPIGDPALLVDPLVLLGTITHLVGQIERSEGLLAEGWQCARAAGDQWFTAYAVLNLGYVDGLLGRYQSGYEQMQEGLALWRAVGDPRYIALSLNFMSPLTVFLGRLDEARAHLEESVSLCTQVNDRWGLGTAYRYLGMTALAQGNIAEAKTFINKSLDIFTGFVTGWDIVQSLVFLGEVTLAEGNLAEAARIFRNALDQALESHSFPLAMDALLGLAQVKADAGQTERACELATYIADHAASIQPTKDRAGQLCQRLLPHCTSQKIADSRLPLSATPAEIAQYFLT